MSESDYLKNLEVMCLRRQTGIHERGLGSVIITHVPRLIARAQELKKYEDELETTSKVQEKFFGRAVGLLCVAEAAEQIHTHVYDLKALLRSARTYVSRFDNLHDSESAAQLLNSIDLALDSKEQV